MVHIDNNPEYWVNAGEWVDGVMFATQKAKLQTRLSIARFFLGHYAEGDLDHTILKSWMIKGSLCDQSNSGVGSHRFEMLRTLMGSI